MRSFAKSLTALAVAAAAVASAPAHAFSISFGGNNASQQNIDNPSQYIAAGLTSSVADYIDRLTNTVTGDDVYLETFDALATGTNSYGLPTRPFSNDPNRTEIQFTGPNGGFVSLNPNNPTVEGIPGPNNLSGGDLTITNDTGYGMGIRKGTASYAAAPGGDVANATYFAYGPGQGGSLPSSVKVSYTGLLSSPLYGAGYGVDYLGIFYGSIDTYNGIKFYDSRNRLIQGSDSLSDGILTGTEILLAMGCPANQINTCSGGQSAAYSNVYLNLSFLPNEGFTAFELYTTGVAVEVDNIVTHVGQIPEPASLALLGLGLFGLAGMRRKV